HPQLVSCACLISYLQVPRALPFNAHPSYCISTLSLHDALPISQDERLMTVIQTDSKTGLTDNAYFIHHPERIVHTTAKFDTDPRSEEHTSELQSRFDLVCRLLLEKKNKYRNVVVVSQKMSTART